MRAVWSGSIGFGLVNIPVKIYSAVQDSRLDIDMLDRKTGDNTIKAKASGKKLLSRKWKLLIQSKTIFLNNSEPASQHHLKNAHHESYSI